MEGDGRGPSTEKPSSSLASSFLTVGVSLLGGTQERPWSPGDQQNGVTQV